jgi:hypothetical protein
MGPGRKQRSCYRILVLGVVSDMYKEVLSATRCGLSLLHHYQRRDGVKKPRDHSCEHGRSPGCYICICHTVLVNGLEH